VPAARAERAPAKVNLTLRVIGRRADGYHDIESLVAFAALGDTLALSPGQSLALAVRGPTARAAGDVADNLVLKAARALAERVVRMDDDDWLAWAVVAGASARLGDQQREKQAEAQARRVVPREGLPLLDELR